MKLPPEAIEILGKYGVYHSQPALAIAALISLEESLTNLEARISEHVNDMRFAIVLIGKDRDGLRMLNDCKDLRKKNPDAVVGDRRLAVRVDCKVFDRAPPENPGGKDDGRARSR